MFIGALFITAKLLKQPRWPTTDEWMKKMWYLYTMGFYPAIKKKEILLFASKWMELKNIILSKVSQVQKNQIWKIGLIQKYKQYYEKQIMLREVFNGRGRVKEGS
jgi:hypothetical protein